MSITVRMSGPLFDGRAARAMQDACDDAREDIAEYAEERVLADATGHFRQSTGYYASRITTTRVSGEVSLVHDQGVVYGPWLEGVGSRNSPVTRFPGYGHWRRTKQAAQTAAPGLAERAVRRHLPAMGG